MDKQRKQWNSDDDAVIVTNSGPEEANKTYSKLINVTHPEGLELSEAILNGFDI